MKIVFLDDRMQIVCEDARDAAFLETCLKTRETGKVFAKMGKLQGKYEDIPMIEVFPYLDKDGRDAKRAYYDSVRETDSARAARDTMPKDCDGFWEKR